MNKTILLASLIPFCMQATQPVEFVFHSPKTSGKTAIITASSGIGAGATIYYALNKLLEWTEIENIPFLGLAHVNIPITKWFTLGLYSGREFNVGQEALRGMVFITAGTIGALAAWLAYSYQPEGKFVAARNKLTQAINNNRLNELLQAQHTLVTNIRSEYVHHTYPRVAAYKDFVRFHKSLSDAREWLHEASNASSDAELNAFARTYSSIIKSYLDDIGNCIEIIRNEPDWLKELKVYEAYRGRKAQEELARVIRMQQMQNQHVVVHQTH